MSIRNLNRLIILSIVLIILVCIDLYADMKVQVCVQAETNSDGFARADLSDPVKDVTKQVKKSKHLTNNCDTPALTITINNRGVTDTGGVSVNYGAITKIQKKMMIATLELPNGRSTIITQTEGGMSRSWGHLAKKFREQVEDFCEMNGVK